MSELKANKLEQETYTASLTAGIEQIAALVDATTSPVVAALQREATTALQKLQEMVR